MININKALHEKGLNIKETFYLIFHKSESGLTKEDFL